jgi:hypothetical protein
MSDSPTASMGSSTDAKEASPSAPSAFVYPPLDRSKSRFRVLTLGPGNPSDDLTATIATHHLDISVSMNPANEQSQTMHPDTPKSTPILHPILLLSILLITTCLTIRSSSQPGGILHGARIWSRNYFHTRVNPISSKQDIADDNSDDDAPYGAPGIFDDHPSPVVRTKSSQQDTANDGDGNGEDDGDVPYGPGIYDKPTPSL